MIVGTKNKIALKLLQILKNYLFCVFAKRVRTEYCNCVDGRVTKLFIFVALKQCRNLYSDYRAVTAV